MITNAKPNVVADIKVGAEHQQTPEELLAVLKKIVSEPEKIPEAKREKVLAERKKEIAALEAKLGLEEEVEEDEETPKPIKIKKRSR